MIISYKCNLCKKEFQKNMATPESETICSCGYKAKRLYKNIDTETENSNVSSAIRTMMFSSLPSGKDKAVS